MKLSEQELAELRERISNEPLEPGGNSHVTARLDDSRPDRWIFREGIAGKSVGLIMLTFGTIIIFTGIWSGVWYWFMCGGFLLIMGMLNISSCFFPATFDWQSGYYFRKELHITFRRIKWGYMQRVLLSEIAALQIIKERCRDEVERQGYYSYELNIVKYDGSRINVLDHYGRNEIETDTGKLAEQLGVPVWGLSRKSTTPLRRKRRWEWIWVGLGCIFMGSLLLWSLFLFPLTTYFAAKNWVRTPATVIKCRIQSETAEEQAGEKLYSIDIKYEYMYDGQYYQCDRYGVGYETHSASLEDDILRIIQQKPADASIYCWVNPDKPQQAIIDRRLQISEELQWLWNPLLFIVIGLAVFTGGVRGRPK